MSDPGETPRPHVSLGIGERFGRKLEETQNRWARLFEKRTALQKNADLETRSDEKLRLEALIAETETQLQALEVELRTLERAQVDTGLQIPIQPNAMAFQE